MERLFEILDNIIKENSLKSISSITVSIGEMRQVIPESFRLAFLSLKKDTAAEKADLIMEFVPVKIRCSICGRESRVKDNIYLCPFCSSVDTEVTEGDEITIKHIEAEK